MTYTLMDFVLDYAHCCMKHLDARQRDLLVPDYIYALLQDCPLRTADGRQVLDFQLQLNSHNWREAEIFVDQNWQTHRLDALNLGRDFKHHPCDYCT
jgi:hypothetical protein